MRPATALERLFRRNGRPPAQRPDVIELAELVQRAVADALPANGDRPAPAQQSLTPEWRVRATLPSGDVWLFRADSEADALDRARRMTHSTFVLEHRLVSAWRPVPTPAPPPPGGSAGDDEGRHSAA